MTARTTALRIGVLGCAGIAERRMLPSILRQPRLRLVAVASRSGDRAAAFAARFGCAPVTGYDALLARPDIDAVYLPLPPHLHARWALRALDAGKHVLCEKPFAEDLTQARAVVAAARERDLVVMESFMFLHHAQHAAVRELVADGAIGELRAVGADFGVPALGERRYVGTLADVAVYPIRAARMLLGDGLSVLGACLGHDDAGTAVSGSALLCSAGGVPAHLRYGLDHGYRAEYALWGSEGHLVLRRAYATPDDHVPVVELHRPDGVRTIELAPDRQFVNVAGAFAATVLDGADPAPAAAEILDHAELVDRVRAAAREPHRSGDTSKVTS